MSEAKPLHVRVAEALGWTNVRVIGALLCNPPIPVAKGRPPGNLLVGDEGDVGVPHYDTDWSATGPLIEKYRIELLLSGDGWYANGPLVSAGAEGGTQLIAVCNLILALKEAGKL